MSSNIELHDDGRVNLDFELKTSGVWLYIHERTASDPMDENWDGALLNTEALTVADLDNMIAACEAVRDFIKRKDGIDG